MAQTGPVPRADALGGADVDSSAMAPVVIRDHEPTVPEMVRTTWLNRTLILRLGLRQIIKGYSGARLGRAWLIIRPVVSTFGMALIFGSVLGAPSNGVPYLLFLLVGMTAWLVIERTVFWGTRSFDIYRKVAGRLDIPVLLVPTAAVAPMAVEVGAMAAITAATAVYYSVTEADLMIQVGPDLLLAVAGFVLGVALAWGIALWLATLNARARDVRLTLRLVLPVWLYVTPVIYPPSALPDRWEFLATINPATAPVELVKEGILGIGSVTWGPLAVSIAATVILCASGLQFLTRLSPTLLRTAQYVEDDEEAQI
jgi:lipopolysaccharide transport system permease protein